MEYQITLQCPGGCNQPAALLKAYLAWLETGLASIEEYIQFGPLGSVKFKLLEPTA